MDNHRDRRLTEAADLRSAVDALLKVQPQHRATFIHDRLMVLIDSCCATHGPNRQPFTAAQILVLKDVCYNIVHVLDQNASSNTGFAKALRNEWSSKSPMNKISIAAAIFIFSAPFLASWYNFLSPYAHKVWAGIISADNTDGNNSSQKVLPQTNSMKLPAANIPSTPATPAR